MKCFLKIYLFWCLWLLAFNSLNAQVNLVSNGNFEINDTCPNNAHISRAVGWLASSLTPDYYDACATAGANVPYTQLGFQKDCCGGSGFAGEYLFYKDTANTGREYICTKLLDTLKGGHKYLASMYVNRCNYFNYSISSVGMLFTDTLTVLPWPKSFISANPQVINTVLLNDTVNWVIVKDTFIASGHEAYLTIGNFNTNLTSDTVMSSGTWGTYGGAYYYIDGVSVYDLATVGIEKIKNKDAEIKVYPNPTNSKIYIETKDVIEVKLFDLLSNEIIITKDKEIDVSHLSEGIYFIQVNTNGNISTQKIIVQH